MARAIGPELVNGIFIVRHGETMDNEHGVLSGHRQIGLSERGMRQAQELGLLLRGIDVGALYASDLQRAVETAALIRPHRCLPIYRTPLLRERDGGSITGMRREAVDWSSLPADVESDALLAQRAALFLYSLQGSAIVIGHEGINKMIISRITGCTPAEARRYSCVSQHCGIDYFRYWRKLKSKHPKMNPPFLCLSRVRRCARGRAWDVHNLYKHLSGTLNDGI